VDEDYLRFDFYADRLLDIEEIQTIELHINSIIQSALIVDIQELEKSEAELL
jgi:alanyl-tRNA synthetase